MPAKAGIFVGMFMLYYVDILQSESTGRYYCGQTNNLDRRILEHNTPSYTSSKTTKRFAGPWRLVWSTTLETRRLAISREKSIKNRGIARFLNDALSGS